MNTTNWKQNLLFNNMLKTIPQRIISYIKTNNIRHNNQNYSYQLYCYPVYNTFVIILIKISQMDSQTDKANQLNTSRIILET